MFRCLGDECSGFLRTTVCQSTPELSVDYSLSSASAVVHAPGFYPCPCSDWHGNSAFYILVFCSHFTQYKRFVDLAEGLANDIHRHLHFHLYLHIHIHRCPPSINSSSPPRRLKAVGSHKNGAIGMLCTPDPGSAYLRCTILQHIHSVLYLYIPVAVSHFHHLEQCFDFTQYVSSSRFATGESQL